MVAPLLIGAVKALPLLMQLADVVPSLMKYTGTSEASVRVAEEVVSIAKNVTGASSPEEAVNNILQDKEKAREFALRINESNLERDKLFLADLQSARERDVELAKAGYRNYRAHSMYILAVGVVIVVFVAVWRSPDVKETILAVAMLVLGRFLGYLDQIYNFEFGKTRNEDVKTQIISNLSANGKH